jgi:hypothetical protein
MTSIPVYINVREVELVSQGGSNYLTCTCGGWNRMRLPCACMLSVVDKIDVTMCHVSWLKIYRNHYGTNTLLGKKLVEMQLKSRTHPGCLLTSQLNSSGGLNFPVFLRGASLDEFQTATKILERAKSNSPIVYRGSLEKSIDESDCNLEVSNVIPDILAGMIEPTLKTSQQTSLLHEMLEKEQVDIVNATKFPDQIELYKEMDNNVKEIIKCVTEPSDVNFVRENLLYITKTLKERRANDAIANDPNRFKKKLISSSFETEKSACHKRLKGSHDYATRP